MARTSTTEGSPTRYFWRRLTAMVAGLGVLVAADTVVERLDGSGGESARITLAVLLAVAAAIAIVGRSVQVIVSRAFSDAVRVFRARHLAVCTAVLLATGTFVAVSVVVREPFRHVFARVRVAGADIVDVATVVAALVCLVGAGVAATGAWDARHVERNWYRTLRVHSRRSD